MYHDHNDEKRFEWMMNEIEFEEIDSPYLYTSHINSTLSIFSYFLILNNILISKISKYPKLYFIDTNDQY